ncbi:hypothetical protein ACQCSX_08775 [Pseudarthrobacter sp. P1]|uniref:hypothetical protein n=1 Tax=Pseudarthrobacter sp. P1 TaxID=3418418 RepID=UPI003CEDA846
MSYKPFTTGAAHWHENSRPARTKPAVITTASGEPVPGVHVEQQGHWFVLTEANAVQLASNILDTIESTKK